MKVKICGIRTKEDVLAAKRAGADGIGVVWGENALTIEEVIVLFKEASPTLDKTLVCVPNDLKALKEAIQIANPDYLQNRLDVKDLRLLKEDGPLLVARIDLSQRMAYKWAQELSQVSDYILLECGSHPEHLWPLAKKIRGDIQKPVILAGSLNVDNLSQAVEIVRPWGVEADRALTRSGKKDPDLVSEFVDLAHSLKT